jgi:hypothetical protein
VVVAVQELAELATQVTVTAKRNDDRLAFLFGLRVPRLQRVAFLLGHLRSALSGGLALTIQQARQFLFLRGGTRHQGLQLSRNINAELDEQPDW